MALKSKKIDGLVIEKPVADAYAKQNKDLNIAHVSFNEEKKPTVIALPKDSPILLEHLNHSIKDVKDKHLINKYMDIASEQMVNDGSFIQKYGTFLKRITKTL